MAKIAFLLLAHKDPDAVAEQVRALVSRGDCVAIHFDGRAPKALFTRLRAALAGVEGVAFARRVRCGWGEFSLVRATLEAIRTARRRFEGITHYYLLSGDCYPIKSREFIGRFLDENPHDDIIETRDFFSSGWIRTGLTEERLIYRHWFNERAHKRLFYASMEVQRRLRLARSLPAGIDIRIGSQWWLLRAGTVGRLLALIAGRRDLVRFFRTTWIPDETFFQTLVGHLVPDHEILCRPPTHLMFSDYGLPVIFHDDHFDYLRSQEQFFARKLSPHAGKLRKRLLEVFPGPSDPAEGGSSVALYPYLAGRGRNGLRYAPRFWERATAPRRDAEVLIVVSKLWHVGKAVAAQAARVSGLPDFGYMFDEDSDLPLALGNLEHGLDKRNRHRQAFLNLVLDALPEPRLIFALDPCRGDVIADIAAKAGAVRLLLVERPLPAGHLLDHARRTGLIGDNSGEFERREVMSALGHEFEIEIEALRRDHGGRLHENRLDRDRAENVLDMGHFLARPRVEAEAVVRAAEKLTG